MSYLIPQKYALFLATLGPAGRMPQAPGTWGSFVALILAPFLFLPCPFFLRILLLLCLFPVGAWCAGQAEKIFGQKDPGSVVIDELWGQWITLLFLPSWHFGWLLLGFVLFRLFDILKPWPVRNSEQWLPGGWGIMLDDGLAGLYALTLCTLLFHL